MLEYYLVFGVLAVAIFAGIVIYTARQEGINLRSKKEEIADILFDKKEPSVAPTTSSDLLQDSKESASALIDAENSNTEQLLGAEEKESVDLQNDSPLAGPQSTKLKASDELPTELTARLKLTSAEDQQQVLRIFREFDYRFIRPVHVFGLNALTDYWGDIEQELPATQYLELGLSIQLADKNGAVTSKELNDFQQMVLSYSEYFNVPFDFSISHETAMEVATYLDNLVRRYNSMAVLNIVPRSRRGFRFADIETCARDLMMSANADGIFVKTAGQRKSLKLLYSLACTDGKGHFGATDGSMSAIYDLVLYLNVPKTEVPDVVFRDMAEDAVSLATWLEGKVVDRNGRVMTQKSFDTLETQIRDISYQMHNDGLEPGDRVTQLLF